MLAALLVGTAAPAQQTLDDLVLAVVNGEEITRRHLVQRLLDYQGDETLQRMINRVLLLQAAKRLNVSVSDEEAEKKLEEIRKQFKREDDFRALLQQNRLNEKQYRDEVRFTLYMQRVALHESPIKDEDLQQFDVRLLVARDKATAETWVKELNAGADFARLSGERSPEPAIRQAGGRMRPFLKIEMLDVWRAMDEEKVKPGGYTKKPLLLPDTTWALVKLEGVIPVASTSGAERQRLETLVTRYRMDQWLAGIRSGAKVETRPLDQPVVAVVNGEPVRRDQLVIRVLEYQGEETLERMINRVLLLQAAKKTNLTLTDPELEKRFAEVRARYKTPEAFQAFLTSANITERQLKEEIRYTTLMEKVALQETPVTDADLTRYDLRMLIAPDRATAEKWIKELGDGGDFAKMAGERSADPQGRESGGKMRPFVKTELLDVWRAIDEQKLKPGAFTRLPVLLTDASWAIIKLEAVLPASSLTPDERTKLTQQVTAYRVTQWLDQTVTAAKSAGKIARPVPLSTAVIRGS